MTTQLVRVAIIVLGAAACAAPVKEFDKPRAEMTQREKDSTIAVSGLPGSGVVKKALSMSDAQEKEKAILDSASHEN